MAVVYIILGVVFLVICGCGIRIRKEGYHAGKGMFNESKYNMNEKEEDISEYKPFHFDSLDENIRK